MNEIMYWFKSTNSELAIIFLQTIHGTQRELAVLLNSISGVNHISAWVAISKRRLEFASIYHGSPNQNIFFEFLKNLINFVQNKYEENNSNIIILFDGAAYHKNRLINNTLNEKGITAIFSVPFTPEFDFVEFLKNFVKSKWRLEMRNGK